MNPSLALVEESGNSPSVWRWRQHPDRLGVAASILCAIHCAATPFLFLLAPAFGRVWAHPASHWLVALLVVPLAAVMLHRGFRRHRRTWIVACGMLGILLVVAGAAIPYTSLGRDGTAPASEEEATPHAQAESPAAEEEFVYVVGQDDLDEGAETHAACPGACCPTLGTDADGNFKLHIPLASIVTTLGGLALIATHLGNLCCCRGCGAGSAAPLA
jgi:hypothetical protein